MTKIILEIIQKSIFNNLNSNILFEDVTWKTQESSDKHVLFYKFNDNSEQSKINFLNRIENITYSLIITNQFFDDFKQIKNIIVVKNDEWMNCQKLIMDQLYPMPVDIKILAVTGTNGKTTTVDLMSQLATIKGFNNITIGTLGVRKNGKKIDDFGLTTPSYIDLRKYFYKYGQETKYFFIEASSHALEQGRFFNLEFEASGWTSFSQDHLDYHQNMQEYFNAKSLILSQTKCKRVYLSSRNQELINKFDKNKIIICSKIETEIKNPFFAANYNLVNLEVAIELLKCCQIKVELDLLEKLTPPPGRFLILNYLDNFIVIDFAHTPDAIENICKSLKQAFNDKQLVTLFGCGGDRDRSKRPLMGQAAQRYSDKIIVTSDNPRFENPQDIINDIIVGLDGSFEVIVDRKSAINSALLNLNNSVLLIAGKGHEDYLDIQGKKIPYSDEQVVKEFINDQTISAKKF